MICCSTRWAPWRAGPSTAFCGGGCPGRAGPCRRGCCGRACWSPSPGVSCSFMKWAWRGFCTASDGNLTRPSRRGTVVLNRGESVSTFRAPSQRAAGDGKAAWTNGREWAFEGALKNSRQAGEKAPLSKKALSVREWIRKYQAGWYRRSRIGSRLLSLQSRNLQGQGLFSLGLPGIERGGSR